MEALPSWLALAQEASFPVLAVAGLVYAIARFITVLPQLRQSQLLADGALRADLLHRIEQLEEEVRTLRKALDQARIAHAGETLDLQHDLANEIANLDALIMLIQADPEKAQHHVDKILHLREKHRDRMAIKRGAREAAIITAQAPPTSIPAAA